MKKTYQKDKIKRNSAKSKEIHRVILKNIFNNVNLSKTVRWNSYFDTIGMKKNSSPTRVVNFCIITKRKKKISKKFHFSRLAFLKTVRSGNVSGFSKSSW